MGIEQSLDPASGKPSEVTYVPSSAANTGGKLDGQAPVRVIGDLKVNQGDVVLSNGYVIDITVPQSGTTIKKTVLSGVTFQNKVQVSGKTATLTGLAFFRQGSALQAIDEPDCEELIAVDGGGEVQGRIINVNREEIAIQTSSGIEKIPINRIKRVCSPRIYNYRMQIALSKAVDDTAGVSGTASQTVFTETTHRCKKNEKQSASSNGSSQSASRRKRRCCGGGYVTSEAYHMPTAAIVGISLVELAALITLPIVLPLALKHPPHRPPVIPPSPPPAPPPQTPSRHS